MSKEFQRIKEREDVRKQLLEFIANSIPRAVSDCPSLFMNLTYLFLDSICQSSH